MAEAREFRRELKLLDATMIVIGSMIGSGIFLVSADIARTVGGAGWLLVSWLVAGVITLIGALSYGELAGMMPHAGGQYVYLREAYNPLTAFLYGWTMFMVIQTGTIAAVGVAFAKFTAVLLPGLGENVVLLDAGLFKVTAARVVAIASILFLTWVNTRGIHGGKIVQDVFTLTKTVALLALIALGLAIGRNAQALAANFPQFWHASWTHVEGGLIRSVEPLAGLALLGALGASLVGSLFSCDAWNNITFTAGEVVQPKRTIPLSLALGTGTVILLYLLANVAYVQILPVLGTPGAADVFGRGIQFATSDRVGVAAATVIFGAPAAALMAGLIMISTFGCNNGLILAGARVYYAMARDRLFFAKAGELNRKSVPGWALAAQAVWASLLCLSGTYSNLLDYVIFAVLVFYILTIWGIFILRRTRPAAERPYRAFGYPLVPGVYILAAAAIALDLLIEKPLYTWPGLGIVLLGIPVYLVWTRMQRGGQAPGEG
ncbi:MAG TPA: amino acid permease [Candidatus Saccharimonadales bacterium]|nr:amino acid permease [Candidatus Saccharimonadales bacterium]